MKRTDYVLKLLNSFGWITSISFWLKTETNLRDKTSGHALRPSENHQSSLSKSDLESSLKIVFHSVAKLAVFLMFSDVDDVV